MSSVEPEQYANQRHRRKKSVRELVVASGESPVLLEFAEEPLDEIALTIEGEISLAGLAAIGFRRDDGRDAALGERRDQGVGVVPLAARNASGSTWSSNGTACVMSCAWPGVSDSATGLPSASTMAWILVVSPPRDLPMA